MSNILEGIDSYLLIADRSLNTSDISSVGTDTIHNSLQSAHIGNHMGMRCRSVLRKVDRNVRHFVGNSDFITIEGNGVNVRRRDDFSTVIKRFTIGIFSEFAKDCNIRVCMFGRVKFGDFIRDSIRHGKRVSVRSIAGYSNLIGNRCLSSESFGNESVSLVLTVNGRSVSFATERRFHVRLISFRRQARLHIRKGGSLSHASQVLGLVHFSGSHFLHKFSRGFLTGGDRKISNSRKRFVETTQEIFLVNKDREIVSFNSESCQDCCGNCPSGTG